MFSHTENKDMLHPSLPGEETALPQSSLYFFFPPSKMKHKWDDSPWWRCNKALIVSARCEIGAEWVPTAPVSAPALRAANTTPASCNPTAASQRLNNLRLKTHTHTHTINQRGCTSQASAPWAHACRPAVLIRPGLAACLETFWVFFFSLKMRGWVEQPAQTHFHVPHLAPTALCSHSLLAFCRQLAS